MVNGAVFFLVVNFIIAICFALVFAVVAVRSQSRQAALWFSAGFAVASLSAISELFVAYTDLSKLFAVLAFATVLGGMILLRFGIGELYGVRIAPFWAISFFTLCILLDLFIYGLPRSTLQHALSYQTPFALVILTSAAAVFASRRRARIDRVLGYLLTATGLHFFAKAGLAVTAGAGVAATDYIRTNYALISQGSTAVLIVAVGLTLLSVLVLDIMADERSNSERDVLSDLANRRGFENGVAAARLVAPAVRHSVITCDIDRFKSINDTFGHHAGDKVIRAFADLLKSGAAPNFIVGRIGGEEFAVFMPNTTVETAMLFASSVRRGATGITVEGLPPTLTVSASFGVAEIPVGESFDDAMRRADMALYEAKRAGRNCVRQARQTRSGSPDIRLVT